MAWKLLPLSTAEPTGFGNKDNGKTLPIPTPAKAVEGKTKLVSEKEEPKRAQKTDEQKQQRKREEKQKRAKRKVASDTTPPAQKKQRKTHKTKIASQTESGPVETAQTSAVSPTTEASAHTASSSSEVAAEAAALPAPKKRVRRSKQTVPKTPRTRKKRSRKGDEKKDTTSADAGPSSSSSCGTGAGQALTESSLPCTEDAFQRLVNDILPMVRTWYEDDESEFEMRLGRFWGTFTPKVTRAAFEARLRLLSSSRALKKSTESFTSAFYDPDQAASVRVRFHTSRVADPEACVVSSLSSGAWSVTNRPISFGASLKQERPIEFDYHTRKSYCVRKHERTSFLYDGWRYDFTAVREGTNNQEADMSDRTYYIELEPMREIIARHTAEEVARLAVLRTLQMVGNYHDGTFSLIDVA